MLAGWITPCYQTCGCAVPWTLWRMPSLAPGHHDPLPPCCPHGWCNCWCLMGEDARRRRCVMVVVWFWLAKMRVEDDGCSGWRMVMVEWFFTYDLHDWRGADTVAPSHRHIGFNDVLEFYWNWCSIEILSFIFWNDYGSLMHSLEHLVTGMRFDECIICMIYHWSMVIF